MYNVTIEFKNGFAITYRNVLALNKSNAKALVISWAAKREPIKDWPLEAIEAVEANESDNTKRLDDHAFKAGQNGTEVQAMAAFVLFLTEPLVAHQAEAFLDGFLGARGLRLGK